MFLFEIDRAKRPQTGGLAVMESKNVKEQSKPNTPFRSDRLETQGQGKFHKSAPSLPTIKLHFSLPSFPGEKYRAIHFAQKSYGRENKLVTKKSNIST